MTIKETIIRKRFWLTEQADWFSGEIIYHRDMSKYFHNTKIMLFDETNNVETHLNVEGLYATAQGQQ